MKRISLFFLIIFSSIILSCEYGLEETVKSLKDNSLISIDFLTVEQFGGTSGTVDSTGLKLYFDKDPETLTIDDITLTGATKGTLSGSGKSRNLSISDISVFNEESITVSISSPKGYSILNPTKSVLIYRAPITVTLSAIPGVTIPVRFATPNTTEIDTIQYTGTIEWNPVDATFKEDTVYTATITLTPKSDYTFEGVSEDFFTVAGADTVSNSENSGTVSAVFPKTGIEPDIDVVFQSLTQNDGVSEETDTTGLTLTFDVDPTTLSINDISVTGATKGELTGTGTTRTLTISDITVENGEQVTVTINSPEDYAITGSPKNVTVFRALYTVTYNVGLNNTSGSVPVDTQTYHTDDSVTVLGNSGNLKGEVIYDTTHKVFLGWNENSSATVAQYETDDTFSINSDITLYAIYTALRVTGPAGGIIFYDKGVYSDGWRYMEVWTADEDDDWWCQIEADEENTSELIGSGYDNTYVHMRKTDKDYYYPAAVAVRGRTYGGKNDWFIPSKDELQEIWWNLISDHSSSNNGRGEFSPNSVGNFAHAKYWSSSRSPNEPLTGSSKAYNIDFGDGGKWLKISKRSIYKFRAVRSF